MAMAMAHYKTLHNIDKSNMAKQAFTKSPSNILEQNITITTMGDPTKALILAPTTYYYYYTQIFRRTVCSCSANGSAGKCHTNTL